MSRLEGLTGKNRLTTEWISGIDGWRARKVKDIARFWGISEDRAEEMVEEAKEEMIS